MLCVFSLDHVMFDSIDRTETGREWSDTADMARLRDLQQ